MEGEGEPAQEFKSRLAKLDEVGGPMTRRAKVSAYVVARIYKYQR
jgi:hypothetical protein